MKPALPLVLTLIAASPVFAAGNGQSGAKALDLSVPGQPTYSYAPTDPRGSSMPPGSSPYDPAKRFASSNSAAQSQLADTCDGKPHGSATVGVGYSSRMGNSNFQTAQLNTCKRYYDDNGNAREVGVSIGIGQGNIGPGHARRGW